MNTIGIIVIALLLVALVVAVLKCRERGCALESACADAEFVRATNKVLLKQQEVGQQNHDKLIVEVALAAGSVKRLEAENARLEERIKKSTLHAEALGYKLQELRAWRKPARFMLEGGMTDGEIERALAGAEGSPIVRAIMAHIGAKLVRKADDATDAPREMITTAERVIEGYTAEMRLHDAGGASHLAELLGELQALTAAKAAEEEKPKAAA